jgi:hypothetical protein
MGSYLHLFGRSFQGGANIRQIVENIAAFTKFQDGPSVSQAVAFS